ncbi:hypothetical protein N431DRAFT_552050 [Stipitochalara longipes BDJ]|nr:hypothetical protein N431DRAFT_552050 [Stipitochalara longipes BDJ]
MVETDTLLSGTAVTTLGLTIQSPQAFYVYTTVKIITAKPVTATDGQVMCGTVSSWPEPNFYDVQATFENINSNAEAYFGGSSIGGATAVPTATATHVHFGKAGALTVKVTATETALGVFFTDVHGNTIDPTLASTGLEITLTTPFIYQPTRGADPATETESSCYQGDGTENFGYVPQTLVDYLAQDPYYVSLYPDLTSCLAAGPSILPTDSDCDFGGDRPLEIVIQHAVGGDLTESTVSTVTPPGPTIPIPSPYMSPPPIVELIAGPAVSSPANAPASPSVGSTTTVNGTPLLVVPPTTIPIQNAPPGLTGSTTVVNGTPLLVVPAETTIPALPGSITVVSGSTFAVFNGPTTVPVNPNLPLQGSTTVISGTTMVVIPSATSVPVLPGSLAVVSGSLVDVFTGPTTVAVNGQLSLNGKTTVIGGVTEVVLTGPTTVAVSSPTGLNYLQVSGAGRMRNSVFKFVVDVARGFGARFR